MAYAIDLSPRQTTRTLEQAARHEARVVLRCLARPENEFVTCLVPGNQPGKLEGLRRATLIVLPLVSCENADFDEVQEECVRETRTEHYAGLIGTYCDATLQLGECRYLFSTDVIAVDNHLSSEREVRLHLARPETIQVAQRRRFWRFGLAQSSQVQLRWTNPDASTGAGVGWLCNVSADGLACRVSVRVADSLGIEQPVKVDFVLGFGDFEHYCLPAVLCNKTPAGTKNTTLLGMQFENGPGNEAAQEPLERLRKRLLLLNEGSSKSKKGVGR